MELRWKRWIYQVEGRRLDVENAWSWTLWAQERVVFDGRSLRKTGGYLNTERSFLLKPDETGLNEPVRIVLFSGLIRIHCRVRLGARVLQAYRVEQGQWRTQRGRWPGEPASA